MSKKCPDCGLEQIPNYVQQCDCGHDFGKEQKIPNLEITKKQEIFGGMLIECPNCKYEGAAAQTIRGSFWIEIVLWFSFLVPGFIYSIWRRTGNPYPCPRCGFEFVIKKGWVGFPAKPWNRKWKIGIGIWLIFTGISSFVSAFENGKGILIPGFFFLGIGIWLVYAGYKTKKT